MAGSAGSIWLRPHVLYRLFKYSVYALLSWNIYLFFLEDYSASAQVFGDKVTWRNVVEAFSATIDTGSWVILLLLFELETAVIDDDRLKGPLKWMLFGIRTACYFFIVYACYGYWVKWVTLSDLLPFYVADACTLMGSGFVYIQGLDDYLPFDSATCQQFNGQALLQVANTQIIGTAQAVQAAINLAVVDIVNATDWILVVILLEIEVFTQIKGNLTTPLIAAGRYVKGALYLILLACAVYWGFEGDFLDFWDAFVWLVAFAFIEMNIFEWHEDVKERQEKEAA